MALFAWPFLQRSGSSEHDAVVGKSPFLTREGTRLARSAGLAVRKAPCAGSTGPLHGYPVSEVGSGPCGFQKIWPLFSENSGPSWLRCEELFQVKAGCVGGVMRVVRTEVWRERQAGVDLMSRANRRARRCGTEVRKACRPLEVGVRMGGCLMDRRRRRAKPTGSLAQSNSPTFDRVTAPWLRGGEWSRAGRRRSNGRPFDVAEDRAGGRKWGERRAVAAGSCVCGCPLPEVPHAFFTFRVGDGFVLMACEVA